MQRRIDPAALARVLRGNDQVLSRTSATGSVATNAHPSKRPALVADDELHKLIDRNRLLVAEFISWQAVYRPATVDGIVATLTALGWLVNLGISDSGLYRVWPYDVPGTEDSSSAPGVPPTMIVAGIIELASECLDLSKRPEAEIALGISRIEWEIGVGPLHPFYDGCGRASRYFSALLCLWHGLPIPNHSSREIYMHAARAGDVPFAEYWVSAPKTFVSEY